MPAWWLPMPDAPARSQGGRPRDPGIGERVLRAAAELIREAPAGEDYTLAQLVERSGTSRAAIYRRFGSLHAVTVAALDVDRAPMEVPEATDLREALVRGYLDTMRGISAEGQAMINKRLVLGLRDPDVQREYWERHVTRRRKVLATVLAEGKARGEIRDDTDIEVVIDLLNGVAYYQGVVRGDWASPAAQERVKTAIQLLWGGIATDRG